MPRFYQDVEAEVDIEIDEFLTKCSSSEIRELVKALTEDGWLKKEGGRIVKDMEEGMSLNEHFFNESISRLRSSYLQMSQEDIDILSNMAKKY